MTTDTLTLSHLRFFAHHGVLPEETTLGQHFDVTVRLEMSLAEAGRSDDLTRTVDYRAIHETVRSVMEGPPRKLAEALAETIATELLQAFPPAQAVEVDVVKLNPPVNFTSAGLAVHMRRTRSM